MTQIKRRRIRYVGGPQDGLTEVRIPLGQFILFPQITNNLDRINHRYEYELTTTTNKTINAVYRGAEYYGHIP